VGGGLLALQSTPLSLLSFKVQFVTHFYLLLNVSKLTVYTQFLTDSNDTKSSTNDSAILCSTKVWLQLGETINFIFIFSNFILQLKRVP
jgi:hypothetical protein